eukprot:tig00000478_g1275.t1
MWDLNTARLARETGEGPPMVASLGCGARGPLFAAGLVGAAGAGAASFTGLALLDDRGLGPAEAPRPAALVRTGHEDLNLVALRRVPLFLSSFPLPSCSRRGREDELLLLAAGVEVLRRAPGERRTGRGLLYVCDARLPSRPLHVLRHDRVDFVPREDLDGISHAAWSACGSYIVTAGDDRSVRVWDVRGATADALAATLRSPRSHTSACLAAAAGRDLRHVVSGGDDQRLLLWQARPDAEEAAGDREGAPGDAGAAALLEPPGALSLGEPIPRTFD